MTPEQQLVILLSSQGYRVEVRDGITVRPALKMLKPSYIVLSFIILAIAIAWWFHYGNPESRQFLLAAPWLLSTVVVALVLLVVWNFRSKTMIGVDVITKQGLLRGKTYSIDVIDSFYSRYHPVKLPRSSIVSYYSAGISAKLKDQRTIHLFVLDAPTMESCVENAGVAMRILSLYINNPFV